MTPQPGLLQSDFWDADILQNFTLGYAMADSGLLVLRILTVFTLGVTHYHYNLQFTFVGQGNTTTNTQPLLTLR